MLAVHLVSIAILFVPPPDHEPVAQLAWFTDARIAGAVTRTAPDAIPPPAAGTYGRGIDPRAPVSLSGFTLHQDAGMIPRRMGSWSRSPHAECFGS